MTPGGEGDQRRTVHVVVIHGNITSYNVVYGSLKVCTKAESRVLDYRKRASHRGPGSRSDWRGICRTVHRGRFQNSSVPAAWKPVPGLLPGINHILPYASPIYQESCAREAVFNLSRTCLEGALDVIRTLEQEAP